MLTIRESGHLWECWLADDGTMDTVIEVRRVGNKEKNRRQPALWFAVHTFRFDGEYASYYRREDGSMRDKGIRELAREGIAGLEPEEIES